jgi:hypothetical protein
MATIIGAFVVVYCASVGILSSLYYLESKEKKRLGNELILMWDERREALDQLEKEKTAVNYLLSEIAKLPSTVVAPTEEGKSVSKRLKEAAALTVQQGKLDVRKGNDELHEFHNIELQKLTILKTILKDGFDPKIVIRYNNAEQEMPLSVYVAQMQKSLN